MRKLIIGICFLLTACASNEPKRVLVPVAVKPPAPAIPPKPVLVSAQLKPPYQAPVVARSTVADLSACTRDDERLRELLSGGKSGQ
jgi:hypothetical protein